MNRTWWKESVVYQIYPRSFYDSNGDGIGDIRGIIQKLDHLQRLGIDVVWLSPVYQSPNDDNGYDVSDYQEIMDEFGTVDDWDEMLAEMHKRGIKLMMDLVVNHTSDEHPWFEASRQSKENPKRDWYIWRPGRNGREPNNWRSFFGGSAWQYDAKTDEYYLHLFSKKQPDLNWENPAVRAAVFEMMHWWLKRGVDGFRMDVINLISKVPGLPDAPEVDDGRYHYGGQFFVNGPRLMEYLQEMKREVLSKYDTITVGEMLMITPQKAAELVHGESGALNMVFHFEHMELDVLPGSTSKWGNAPLDLVAFKRVMSNWQNELSQTAWNSLYLSNHDQPRSLSRFGNDRAYRVESSKMLATCLHMHQGTPYIYQGEEIGMTNVYFPSIEDYRDIESLNKYRELVKEQGLPPEEAIKIIQVKSRDNARTPMQWDDSEHAGFTEGTPWIKVNPNYETINVKQARSEPDSIFSYYQRLIRLRKQHPIIVYGEYELLLDSHQAIYAFTRTLGDEQLLVVLNFTEKQPVFELPPSITFDNKAVLISNYDVDPDANIAQMTLRPYEAVVFRLQT